MLSLPRCRYPQNALILASVRLRNVSRHKIWWSTTTPQFGFTSPRIEVVGGNGGVLYPPPFADFLSIPEPVPAPVPIKPGGILRLRDYVILRSGRLRAVVQLFASGKVPSKFLSPLRTPLMHVKVFREAPPEVAVHVAGQKVYADIQPAVRVSGKLLYMDSAECAGSDWAQHNVWTTSNKRTLTAGCNGPKEWNVAAGWVGHSVADIQYRPRPGHDSQ